MSKLENMLMPNEKILLRAQIHEAAVFIPLLFLVLVTGITVLLLLKITSGSIWLVLIFVAAFITYTAAPVTRVLIAYFTSEFAVTNQRILSRSGLFNRHTTEILLNKVESIKVDQGLSGRLFDYGTIEVTGTGGSKSKLPGIGGPFTFRSNINKVLEHFAAKTAASS